MVDREQAKGIDLRLGFRFDRDRYTARLSNGAIDVAPSERNDEDFLSDGSPDTLATAVYGGPAIGWLKQRRRDCRL